MSWFARLRAWLAGEDRRGRRSGGAGRRRTRGHGRPLRAAMDPELLEFLGTRRGVEAFVEPATAMHARSVLVVAADGEYLRRPVPDLALLERGCRERGIPVYDASRVGYPRRLREPGRGTPPPTVDLGDLPPWPGDEPGR